MKKPKDDKFIILSKKEKKLLTATALEYLHYGEYTTPQVANLTALTQTQL